MFISKKEKEAIVNNIKFLIDEVQALKTKVARLEGWKSVSNNTPPKNEYKWMKEHPFPASKPVVKKRGRPVGSKNKK